jgi:uncharacterized membrane protein
MEIDLHELANLLLRWLHVFAGILWIGQTWLFMWMDKHIEDQLENPGGRLFMVHSGGFYVVEKKPGLDALPKSLHWFKWEAALTWATGLLLLVVVYYMGGLLLLPESRLPGWAAIALSLVLLPVGWEVYDRLWRAVQGRADQAGTAASFVLLVGSAWALGHVFSARAAFLQVGAMLGTIMARNVWDRIIPAQQAMVSAMKAGTAPDLTLGVRAKERSKHNTFMVVPLVLIMLSSHFPTLSFGHSHAWLMLGLFTLFGWAAAAAYRRH